MKIEAIHGDGKRANNQDYYIINEYQKQFIVCDGVGGGYRGDIASKMCAEVVNEFLQNNNSIPMSESKLHKALDQVSKHFSSYAKENEDALRMATTFTMAKIEESKCHLAHIGDSKIVYISQGYIAYESKDHSLVNALIDNGTLSATDAVPVTILNKITKSVSVKDIIDYPDYYIIDNIHLGDIIILCTDGILETVSVEELVSLFTQMPFEDAVRSINDKCTINSSDNFTALIIKI